MRGCSQPFLVTARSVAAERRWLENAYNLARFWGVPPREVFDLPMNEVDEWCAQATRIDEAEKKAAEEAARRAAEGS